MNKLLLVLISAVAFTATPSFATPSSETSMVSSVTDHLLMTKKKGKSHKKAKKHKAG